MLMPELKPLQVSELVERKVKSNQVRYPFTNKVKLAFSLLKAVQHFAAQPEEWLEKM
jgi:DNA-binding HxlR family transcriptional regulator